MTNTTTAPVTLRGSVMRHNLKAIRNLYGADGYERIMGVLKPNVREKLEHVVPVEGVPVDVFAQLHEAVRATVGNGKWDAAHAIGMEAARLEFAGVYRVLIRAIHYDDVWDRIQRTWDHIVGTGAFRWIERNEGHARAEIAGVPGFNLGCWWSAAGRCEKLLLLSGAKSANVSIVEHGVGRATFDAVWLT
jgi:hypothetical protein